MRAVALVGGEGTRLRPLTLGTPKQMLPVAEVPMIERVLAPLAGLGIEEVVLSMRYRPDAFLAAYPEGRCAGIPIVYAVEPEPLDTGGAIRFAATAAGIDDTFVVINGDVIADRDISALLTFHRERGAEATLALTPVDDVSAFGVVPTDADGRVVAFIEKPRPEEAPTNFINAGTYVFEPSVLARIPANTAVHIETETFPAMVDDGSLYALGQSGYWTDVGTPELYLRANLDMITGVRAGPPAPHARQRHEGVWTIGASVVHGHVEPPVLLGDATFVDHHAVVRRSVVGSGCRVERGAEVVDSVILPGAAIRPGALVRGSIVGEGALVGDDAVVEGCSVVQGGAHVPSGARLAGAKVEA